MNMPLSVLNRRRRIGAASTPAFSPATLFALNEPGVWLDPSDLSTMFSDRAGTTPVTTPGTVVGLRLDKSKGLTLGAELVTNGTFADGTTTGWTSGSAASTAAVVSGEMQVTAVSAFGRQVTSISTAIGKTYTVTGIGRFISGSGVTGATLYQTNSTGTAITAGLVNSETSNAPLGLIFTATATTSYVSAIALGDIGAVAAFDNISVRELPGNHAVAPTDAARPTYGVEPKGGRRNLLTYSEQMDNAIWAKTNTTVTSNAAAAPDNTTTADKLVETTASAGHFASQDVSVGAVANTYSVYLKADTRTRAALIVQEPTTFINRGGIFDLSSGTYVGAGPYGAPTSTSILDVGGGWYRVSISTTTAVNNATILLVNSGTTVSYTGDGTSGILIWGAQLELGSTAANYQRVLSAYDITEAGVATTHYVQYDGSDDSMSTAAIDFTATDKMSVFAGVRKLSDAAPFGIIAELGINSATGGGFGLATYWWNRGNRYGASTRSTNGALYAGGDTASVFVAPISNVLTSLHDLAGSTSAAATKMRANGSDVALTFSSATSGSGGAFQNFSLFFGRRNNATNPFNGRDYGLIVVGKAASAGEITDTETWLAARTAQVTI